MKNLPDDEVINSLANRLENYNELPTEDVWERISVSIPSTPGWVIWTNRVGATLSVIVLAFLLYNENESRNATPHQMSVNVVDGDKRVGQQKSSLNSEPTLQSPETESEKNSATKEVIERFVEKNATITHRAVDHEVMLKDIITIADNVADPKAKVSSNIPVEKTEWVAEDKLRSDSLLSHLTEIREDSVEAVEHVLPPRPKKKKSRLTFYSMVSPSLSFHHVIPDSRDGVVVEKVKSPGVISLKRFGYSIETGIQGQIGKRFQYLAGLSYYHQSQRLEYEETRDGVIVESGDEMDFVIKPKTTSRSFDYSMRNIGVQAGILYTLKSRGLMHKTGVIIQYQQGLMQANDDVAYDNSSSNYLNYQLFYRLEYKLRSGISLFVQPAYTHSIVANEQMNAPFKLKQSRAGLGIGIVYGF